MKLLKVKTFLFFFFFSLVILAQEETIDPANEALITDRPDATESPSVMPKGFIQFETGAFYESFEENNIKNESYTYNTTLVRYGVLDNLELRLGWNFTEGITKVNDTKLDDISSGFSSLLIGVKVGIMKPKNGSPEIGLLVHTSHPFFASSDYETKSTGVDFRFALSHDLSERSTLSYNLGMVWDGNVTTANYIYTISYGYSINEALGVYAELYGDLPEDSNFNHFWDAGLTYLISNNFQLDATVGSSITKGQDILLSAGFSYRIPKTKQ